MGKSFREGRRDGLSHWDDSGYGYETKSGKGFKVVNRQEGKKNKKQNREDVYADHERVVNY